MQVRRVLTRESTKAKRACCASFDAPGSHERGDPDSRQFAPHASFHIAFRVRPVLRYESPRQTDALGFEKPPAFASGSSTRPISGSSSRIPRHLVLAFRGSTRFVWRHHPEKLADRDFSCTNVHEYLLSHRAPKANSEGKWLTEKTSHNRATTLYRPLPVFFIAPVHRIVCNLCGHENDAYLRAF